MRQGDAVAAFFDLAAGTPDLPVTAEERTAVTVTIDKNWSAKPGPSYSTGTAR
jgi:hypothetical protein